MARARAVPAISTSAGSTSYAAKSTGAPLYVSRRTAMRFHGTATSRAYSAKVRSHFPESGSGRAANAGASANAAAATLSVRTRYARPRSLALVEDRPGHGGGGRAGGERVLALLVLLER